MQVGLAGPSGAGKTAFARKIQNLIPGCTLLSMDNYNDGSKVIDGNFDDPRITDFETLLSNLEDLKAGRPAQVPIYDFKESRRVGYTTVPVPESRVVILEGIYALSHRVRPHLDLRVSITGGVHFDLVKRVLRDIDRSGQAPEEIIQQVSDTVHPMYKAFIEPDLKAAHLRIQNPFNPFSGFMSPTYILKSAHPVEMDMVRSVLGADAARKSESETYDIYLVPPGEDPETCQSWLRMRYRDGRYNLMFEEWVLEGKFIISPRVTFEVPVRILGGLMALGYEIGTIMQRTSESYSTPDGKLTVKVDRILGMDRSFVQIQGKDRAAVAATGTALGLDGTYIPHSYIELVQLENLTQSFQTVTEDLKRRFAVNGEPLVSDEHIVGSFSHGSSPMMGGSFTRTTGFRLASPSAPLMSTSAPGAVRIPTPATAQRQGLLSQRMNAAAGGGVSTSGSSSMLAAAVVAAVPGAPPSRSTRSPSSGGASTAAEDVGLARNGSRPHSPTQSGVDVQLRKLTQAQALLTSQMEELTLQLSLAHARQQQQESAGVQGWRKWSAPLGYATAGVAMGALATMLLLRP